MKTSPVPAFFGEQNRYEIQLCAGEGGTGSVYRAWDHQKQRLVAIKRLRITASGPESGPQAELLLQEARTLSSLNHPNIVSCYEAGLDSDGVPFVVMEWIPGEPLDKDVARGPLATSTFFAVAEGCLSALAAAHERGILHRDLKPSNILVEALSTGEVRVKLLDFGLATSSSEPGAPEIQERGKMVGSIHSMAPEQFERAAPGARTDLYQLGCVFYFALTARQPFTGRSRAEVMAAHLLHRVIPARDLVPDIPPALAAWVHHLMAREPTQRPASAREALRELRGIRDAT